MPLTDGLRFPTLPSEVVGFSTEGAPLFFQQVLYRDLGCASYVLGDAGEAIVVDPRWEVGPYLDITRREGLRLTHVLDTHDHADHVSGRRRLARVTGARACRPARPGEPHPDDLFPGDEVSAGALRLRALETPGHRPEHLAFAVSDQSRSSATWCVLSGDSMLVGDLARPDLAVDAIVGAQALHRSLASLLALGDHVELWPAHIGGSLCGGAGLSRKTSSTIGFERLHNPLLGADRATFVRGLVQSIPPRPPNIARIVELNRTLDGPEPSAPGTLGTSELRALLRAGATVIDARDPRAFDDGHLAGAINLPLTESGVGTRAGWAVGPHEPIVVVASSEEDATSMADRLQAVGLWSIRGYAAGDRASWERSGLPVATAVSWGLERLAVGLRRDAVELIDVREPREWQAGHVPGSQHLPLHQLGRVATILGHGSAGTAAKRAPGRTTAVACVAGVRAALAASLIRRAGRQDVVRVAGGGIHDLRELGIGLTTGTL